MKNTSAASAGSGLPVLAYIVPGHLVLERSLVEVCCHVPESGAFQAELPPTHLLERFAFLDVAAGDGDCTEIDPSVWPPPLDQNLVSLSGNEGYDVDSYPFRKDAGVGRKLFQEGACR